MTKLTESDFDPLDMHNYRMENLPPREKTSAEKTIAAVGAPLAILSFILIMWVLPLSFLERIDLSRLSEGAHGTLEKLTAGELKKIHAAVKAVRDNRDAKPLSEEVKKTMNRLGTTEFEKITGAVNGSGKTLEMKDLPEDVKPVLNKLVAAAFVKMNVAMLAIFVAGLILWMTEAIPNYLTSLIIIISLIFTGVLSEKVAYAQLGHVIMWLNLLSFILTSTLVVTGAAKRFALWFILRFGQSPNSIFLSFLAINLVLSAFISATTPKAAIILPIFMVVAAVYGATGGKNKNNFGRNILLQNLFFINIGASAYLTGSGANLLAASMILGATGKGIFFQDWLIVAFPGALFLLFTGWFVSTRLFFPLSEAEKTPHIQGGMETLKGELAKMGPIGLQEIKAVTLFLIILVLWATDKFHGISPTAVAFLGAIIALLPGIGIIRWDQVDVPWHLMLFSAGAYTLGAGLDATDLPATLVNVGFNALGIARETPFWKIYLALTGGMLFSALLSESKTMRTMIFVPIALGVEKQFGLPALCLSLPVALLIEHVYVLPFNSKPALLLYSTDQYSFIDGAKFGLVMMTIGWIAIIFLGETYFHFLGYTPNGVFGFF